MLNSIQESFLIYLPIISHATIRVLVIFTVGLSAVYLEGRMLGLVKSDRRKKPISFFNNVSSFLLFSFNL